MVEDLEDLEMTSSSVGSRRPSAVGGAWKDNDASKAASPSRPFGAFTPKDVRDSKGRSEIVPDPAEAAAQKRFQQEQAAEIVSLSSTLTELSKTVETMRAAAAKDGAELEKLRALLREGEASLAEEKRLRAAAERSADSSSADAEHRLKMQAVEADRRLAEVVVRTRAEAEAEHRSNLSALQDSHARDREALLSDLKTQKARAQVAEDQLTELTKRRAAEAGEDQQARQDQERVRASQRELEALRTDLSDLQARHASASEARVKAAAELEAARAQAEAAGRERDSLQEALAQTALAAQTAEGEAAQLRTAALLCKQELDALAADYRKLRASVDPSAESPSEAALRRGKAVAEVLTT